MKIPFIQWLIQGIPECIAVVVLGLAVVERKFLLKKALIPGLILALILFFLRQLSLPYGFHTLFGFFSLSILFSSFARINYSKALVVSFFVYTLLGLTEYIVFTSAVFTLGLPVETLLSKTALTILIGLPQVFIFFLLSFLLVKLNNQKGDKGFINLKINKRRFLSLCRLSFFTAPGWKKIRKES